MRDFSSWDPVQEWMALTRVQLVFASSVNKSVFFFISVEINTHLKLPDAKASTGELIVTFVNLLCL